MINKATDNISFHYQMSGFKFPNRTQLKTFLATLFKREKKALEELSYIFCTDKYLLEINRSFLQHDYYTDIISFELADKKQPSQGEIYISIDRVKENARDMGESFQRELHRVIFHGALHLCGYRDKSKKESALMREKENEYLKLYFKN
ncbi:MAG: rRNA maturation RNase YbeY [Flavihumibacter sp.]|nr:rRNA maturation RNase YbeY [Flavihumibacter sp.]